MKIQGQSCIEENRSIIGEGEVGSILVRSKVNHRRIQGQSLQKMRKFSEDTAPDIGGSKVNHWRNYGQSLVDPGSIIDRSAGDAYSSMALDPTSNIFRGPCTPVL